MGNKDPRMTNKYLSFCWGRGSNHAKNITWDAKVGKDSQLRLGLQEPQDLHLWTSYMETWCKLKIWLIKKKAVKNYWLSPETDHLDDERDSLSPYLPVNVEVTLDWVSSLLSAPSPLGWKGLVLASEDPASWLLKLPLQDHLRFGPQKKMPWVRVCPCDPTNPMSMKFWSCENLIKNSPGMPVFKDFSQLFLQASGISCIAMDKCHKNAPQQQVDKGKL